MPDDGSDLCWTDEQWATVQRTAQEAARKARVASSFLPLVGPLPPGQAYVPTLGMNTVALPGPLQFGQAMESLTVNDVRTTALITVSCNVHLTTTQADDPDLAAAIDMVCRAAALVGRLEDAYVFNGSQVGPNSAPHNIVPELVLQYTGADDNPGLLNVVGGPAPAAMPAAGVGTDLVDAVNEAVGKLEEKGQYGPFACVLNGNLFLTACGIFPGSLVPPSDRIMPLLGGGPLLRSSSIPAGPPQQGVVVALGCRPVDLVVGSDVHVSYVQRTLEPRYVLRVSERFVLRIKQPEAVCKLTRP